MGWAALALLAGCSSDGPATAPPVIRPALTTAEVGASGGACEILYTIDGGGLGARADAASDDTWLHGFDSATPGRIRFEADANPGDRPRMGEVRLLCPGAETVRVAVVQGAPEREEPFRIVCSDPSTSAVTVEWTPATSVGTYFSMVTEKAYFDRFDDEASYIADDMEYLRRRAELYEKTFEEVLATYLADGPRTSRIEGLKPATEYYAYAYGLTAGAVLTTGIVRTLFSTLPVGPVDCTFSFRVDDRSAFGAVVGVEPTDKGCTYFWDCVPRTTFDAFGTSEEAIATNIEYIRQAVEIMQMAGYDYTFADFLTTGDDAACQEGLSPATDYVVFAFGLDESGVATTRLFTQTFRTEPFVPTDACTFRIGFERVETSRMHVTVEPSDPATRYYVGLTAAANLDRYTVDELAAALIEEENRAGTDWSGDRYLFTGTRSLDSADDLGYADLTADTEYAAIVFGIDAEGVRTTETAHAVQRTAQAAQSGMRVDIAVTNVTPLGAYVVFRPTVDDKPYFTDCIDYATYAGYGDDEAFVRAQVAALGEGIGAYLTVGYHTLDAEGFLDPETEYIAYAFGYDGGVTTPLMRSERFTTPVLTMDSDAAVRVTAEVRDGDDFYADDPVRYAAYRGKAVVSAQLTPNEFAEHWYAGTFRDLSSYDDPQVIRVLKVQGKRDANELANLVEWGDAVTYAVVAMDGRQAYGSVSRVRVAAERTAVSVSAPAPSIGAEAASNAVLPAKDTKTGTVTAVQRIRSRKDPAAFGPGRGMRLGAPERPFRRDPVPRGVRCR